MSVEYDGYYIIDIVARGGFKSVVACRGHKLKSWLNFEKSLQSETTYRQVTEEEYMKHHWSGIPYVEDEEVKPKKAAKKAVKKAVKKPAAKKAAPKKVTKKVKK